jgi:hypothetical protein
MKIAIESTRHIVEIMVQGVAVPARLWVGKTESGIEVQCLVTRISALETEDLAEFDRELNEVSPPTATGVAFPLRMIL